MVAFLLLAPSLAAPAANRLLVAVGDVSASHAVVWARGPGEGPLRMEYGPAGASPTGRASLTLAHSQDFTGKILLTGLRPATRYAYRVEAGGATAGGEFVTAPAADDPAPVTFLWSGDLGGSGFCRRQDKGYRIFATMARHRPDFFLFVGDTIYADQRCRVPESVPGSDFLARSLRGFRAKYRYSRTDPAVHAFLRTTSVSAIWDDHEVVNDFAGPSEPLMPVGRQAFLEYWPIQSAPGDPTRLYREVRWGRLVDLFILDTRQYRSPNAMPDGPGKTMLGVAQRDWLLEGLRGSDAVWKVVVSSVSLSIPTGREARDSWANGSTALRPDGTPTGFEHELLGIVRQLAAHRVRNVVWLVADVHRAEVIRHTPLPGLVFHELVAGPLSASMGRPGILDHTLRPTRLYGEGGFYNFGELHVTEAGLTVRIIDAAGRGRFETTLAPEL